MIEDVTQFAADVRVRPAGPQDIDFIVESNRRMAFETERLSLDAEVLSRGVRAVIADASKGVYLIGTVGGVAAGQLMITYEWSDWRDGCIWWIQSVYVSPEFRRRGVFKAIYRHAEELARDAGAIGLRLYVEAHNAAAQATYQRLGMIRSPYLVMSAMWGNPGSRTGGD